MKNRQMKHRQMSQMLRILLGLASGLTTRSKKLLGAHSTVRDLQPRHPNRAPTTLRDGLQARSRQTLFEVLDV